MLTRGALDLDFGALGSLRRLIVNIYNLLHHVRFREHLSQNQQIILERTVAYSNLLLGRRLLQERDHHVRGEFVYEIVVRVVKNETLQPQII